MESDILITGEDEDGPIILNQRILKPIRGYATIILRFLYLHDGSEYDKDEVSKVVSINPLAIIEYFPRTKEWVICNHTEI